MRGETGCHFTTLFGNTNVPTAAPATPTKKHTMLPILVVLFLISYGLMTMLIVEQGSTIESQRALIRELFRDSRELSAMKGKAIEEHRMAQSRAQTQAQTPGSQAPSAHTPSTQAQAPTTQTPSTQIPKNQAPSTQAGAQPRTQKTEKTQKPLFAPPSKPASDQAEDRRAVIVI